MGEQGNWKRFLLWGFMVLRSRFLETVRQVFAILVLSAITALGVNQFRGNGLPLVGDWSPKAQLSELKTVEEPVASLEEARALFLTQGAVFIDARSNEAYSAGHIQGSINLPADHFDEFFTSTMGEVPPDSLIITYCDGESCTLSKELALSLAGKGYAHVRVLVNGWSVWLEAKLPVETGGN